MISTAAQKPLVEDIIAMPIPRSTGQDNLIGFSILLRFSRSYHKGQIDKRQDFRRRISFVASKSEPSFCYGRQSNQCHQQTRRRIVVNHQQGRSFVREWSNANRPSTVPSCGEKQQMRLRWRFEHDAEILNRSYGKSFRLDSENSSLARENEGKAMKDSKRTRGKDLTLPWLPVLKPLKRDR